MSSNHVKPGVAAIALALLFPMYWTFVLVVGVNGSDFMDNMRADILELTWLDGVFLLIGALEIYIYYSLARVFDDRLPSNAAKILLYIIIGTVVLFHLTVVIDLYLAVTQGSISNETIDMFVTATAYLLVATLVVFVIAGVGLSITILSQSESVAPILKAFAILLLVICILQATVLFAMLNLILFPIALVTLAVYFFKDPETLEIV